MAHAELCRHLLEHSVRIGTFTLKSGRTSTWFIDAKQTACRPEGITAIADAMLAVLPDDIDAIGGLTLGADPVAYGVAGRLAGALLAGDRVAITEDCVTRGTSPMEAAEVVSQLGATPALIIPVVDRGGTVGAMAAARGIPCRPLVTAPDLGFPYEGA